MGTTSPDLFIDISIDRSRPRHLRAQIEDALREAIQVGRLLPGTRLPSSRALAVDLGVTRGVVVDVYDQLAAEGYVTTVQGSGTTVNAIARHDDADRSAAPLDRPPALDFRPGLPDLSLFPRAAWARATRAAFAALPDVALGYSEPAGLAQLRQVLAGYLGRVRGVSCEPEQVLVCNGFSHALSLILPVLVARGYDEVAVELPGHEGPRAHVHWAGARLRAIAVDQDGLRVDELAASGARVVVVTPAHQYPTGVVLSAARRTELVSWAHATAGYVIEDDYDAEYRYDRHPVGSLQGIAPDRVIYSGTTSKSLAPGLRLGWVVVPPELVSPLEEARRATDQMTAVLAQATLAVFIERGDLDRHLRRTRRLYRQRRDALVDALARGLPEVVVGGVSAGLHMTVTLPDSWDAHQIEAAARQEGVGVYPLKDDLVDPAVASSVLLLGYGVLTPAQIEDAIQRLANVVKP